ncbi:unnamed protein product [Bemisia tabaci]|uniref:RRM domain-containing protein n=1 Tax=Bemisia tabaci TaxID=7038 RepID=A0A9P0G004_BEMTA|nr:unnamed protein product [Bemisia tabaci]
MSYGRPPPRIEGMVSLKVDNLTYRTTPEDLRRVFERCGEVGDIYIPRDRYSRESRGFAFVSFNNHFHSTDSTTKEMLKTHSMQWTEDFWMVGNSVFKWLAMEDHHLPTDIAEEEGPGLEAGDILALTVAPDPARQTARVLAANLALNHPSTAALAPALTPKWRLIDFHRTDCCGDIMHRPWPKTAAFEPA